MVLARTTSAIAGADEGPGENQGGTMKASPFAHGARRLGIGLGNASALLCTATALLLAGCSPREAGEPTGSAAAPLKLDPDFVNPNDPSDSAEPASNYTLFEVDPVRPIA